MYADLASVELSCVGTLPDLAFRPNGVIPGPLTCPPVESAVVDRCPTDVRGVEIDPPAVGTARSSEGW